MATATSSSFSQYSLFVLRVVGETGSPRPDQSFQPLHGLSHTKPQMAPTPISRFEVKTTAVRQGQGPVSVPAAAKVFTTVTATPNPAKAMTPSSSDSMAAFGVDGRSLDRPQIPPTMTRLTAKAASGCQARDVPDSALAASRSFTVKHTANSAKSVHSAAAFGVGGRSWSPSSVLAVIENLLDRKFEKPGDAEDQRERGIMLAGLDRVDRLTRHVEPQGQVGLAPVALGPQDLEAVFHVTRTCLYVRQT